MNRYSRIVQENILSVFGSRLKSRGGNRTDKTQYYAYKTFASFVGGRDISESDYDEPMMTEWASWMFYEGLSRNTVLSYQRLVYALSGDSGYSKNPDVKRAHLSVRQRIQDLPETIFRQNVGSRVIHRLQALMERRHVTTGDTRLGIDLVMFSVLGGGIDFRRIAGWKREDVLPDSPLLEDIHRHYDTPRHKYLFPLGQSEQTPRQVQERLTGLFRNALRSCGLNLASDPASTGADLWLTAVYESTGSIRRAVDLTGMKSGTSPVFVMMEPGQPAVDDDSERVLRLVRDIIVNDPVQWHVMRLRQGVTYDRVAQRLIDNNMEAKIIDVYCPLVEIARKTEHKIVFDDRPAISGLAFFMSRASDIIPLFRHIGDLAWCYRTGRNPGSPYAVITDQEIRTLQQAIGFIDPKGEVSATDTVSFEPGDRILIRSGEMAGMSAEITLVEKKSGELLYHLRFPEGNGLSWTVSSSRFAADKIQD